MFLKSIKTYHLLAFLKIEKKHPDGIHSGEKLKSNEKYELIMIHQRDKRPSQCTMKGSEGKLTTMCVGCSQSQQ